MTVIRARASKTSRDRRELLRGFKDLEDSFNEAFELIETFQSTARMKMLMMMSQGPVDIALMRKRVNPKLVYENISLMQERRLIEEVEGSFNLTAVGKRILMEYFHFLENLQKTVWET